MQQIFLLFIILLFTACEQQYPETPANTNAQNMQAESAANVHNVLKLYNALEGKGAIVYKENCAACHCTVHSACDSPDAIRFPRCEELSVDSLAYLKRFITDSKKLREAGNAFAVKAYQKAAGTTYDHNFGLLSEEEKTAVFVFICGN